MRTPQEEALHRIANGSLELLEDHVLVRAIAREGLGKQSGEQVHPEPKAYVSHPMIHVEDLKIGYGQTLNHSSFTLSEARTLMNVLGYVIGEYVSLYGEEEAQPSG